MEQGTQGMRGRPAEEGMHAIGPADRPGGRGGRRHEQRDVRDFGGRVGARLEELDAAAREAFREASERLGRSGPVQFARRSPGLVLLAALLIGGLVLGWRRRSGD